MPEPMVSLRELDVRFSRSGQTIHAVNGVSLDLASGEVLGVLGESGSGKSVTLRAMLRILPAHRSSVSGAIRVDGKDVLALKGAELEDYRGGTVSMIFQEPMLAFDPVFTVGQQIAESVRRHLRVDAGAARARALEMLERVQIPSAKRRLDAYPHEMSGGMRQRAMIALALACKPNLLLLRELQREFGMSVIFVTHDVGVAIEVSDRVAVMYAGRIVETGKLGEVIRAPRHPYTQGLLASTVRGELRGQRIEAIPGAPPDLAALPPGCAFAPRCRQAGDACLRAVPGAVDLGGGHEARCVLLKSAA